MHRRSFLALTGAGLLAGCGNLRRSRLGRIFGGPIAIDSDTSNPNSDPRPLIREITALRLEKIPGGAIIHATGLPARQGYFDAELVPLNRGLPVNGVLAYQFRVNAPAGTTPVGTPRSREVIVGLFVSDQTLASVQQIQVSAATNALAVRR